MELDFPGWLTPTTFFASSREHYKGPPVWNIQTLLAYRSLLLPWHLSVCNTKVKRGSFTSSGYKIPASVARDRWNPKSVMEGSWGESAQGQLSTIRIAHGEEMFACFLLSGYRHSQLWLSHEAQGSRSTRQALHLHSFTDCWWWPGFCPGKPSTPLCNSPFGTKLALKNPQSSSGCGGGRRKRKRWRKELSIRDNDETKGRGVRVTGWEIFWKRSGWSRHSTEHPQSHTIRS